MSGIKDLILSLKSPIVFHGKVSEWDMLKWNEEDWCTLFGDEPVPFRCGSKKCTPDPQWERTCTTEYVTMSEFFKTTREPNSNSWKYFDYKYLSEWLRDSQALKTMSWANFGFPEITKDECTLWIGSSGAHTPCHMDSYGCNLVAQIRGHKQWILFPPSESAKLKMTRVPYEESSVYSALNFNAPIGDICDSLDNVHIVTLSPGDVLFLPNHWWHYVENLDTAIAINTWIPLPEDDDNRLDEVLVRFVISQASSNLSPAQWSQIVNPNEDELSVTDLSSTMTQIKVCIENVLKSSNLSKASGKEPVDKSNKCKDSLDLLGMFSSNSNDHPHQESKRRKVLSVRSEDMPNCSASNSVMKEEDLMDFKLITKSEISELKNILDAKCKCGSKEEHTQVMKSNENADNTMELLPAVINAFCHPDVLKNVKKLLLQQYCNKEM